VTRFHCALEVDVSREKAPIASRENQNMKRNWETIRELLTNVEECTLPGAQVRLSSFPQERSAEISYHMALLFEAGLVHGQMSQTLGPAVKDFFAQRLTWDGHELLDAIRSDTVWNKTKKVFTEQGVSMTFDLVREVAKKAAASLMAAAMVG
jgi:hypothetical protein